MEFPLIFCVFIGMFLSPADGHVVNHFSDSTECLRFFYKEKVPDLGASLPNVVRICQRFLNAYHFATLYDTSNRIAVYSAYIFDPSNSRLKEKRWFVEPQLVNLTWSSEMEDGHELSLQNPGVYLGEKQALYEDYQYSQWDRGHLNPCSHHADPSCNATFTYTNMVPQNRKLNNGAWNKYEFKLKKMFNHNKCHQAYVLTGAIPSSDNWIVKNGTKRVNIPDHIWNAYCCTNQNDRPILTGGAIANNTEQNVVTEKSLNDLIDFLQQFYDAPIELFSNKCKASSVIEIIEEYLDY